jgi:hypothetical protein
MRHQDAELRAKAQSAAIADPTAAGGHCDKKVNSFSL